MGSKNISSQLKKIYSLLLNHFGPQNWWPAETPFEVCVGAILTQNTAWGNVEKALKNLKERDLLTPQRLYGLPIDELSRLIIPSGYYNIKARRLRNFLSLLVNDFQGDLKVFFNQEKDLIRRLLLEVKGIGPETADSILLYAGHLPFFVVDAYTKRIFFRLNLIPEEISYEELQDFFMRNLPGEVRLFNEYHALIVMEGKNFCRKKPVCPSCPLQKICLYSESSVSIKSLSISSSS